MAGPGVDLVQVIFDRSVVSPNEDVAVVTMHCRGVVSGLPDSLNPMDDTNRDNFAGKLDTWFNAIKTYFDSAYVLTAYKFYALPATSTDPMGSPAKTYARSLQGASSSGNMPTQAATSVTFITDKRRTWGRFYLPGIRNTNLSGFRWNSAMCDAICTATKALTSRSATGACLTVWSRAEWTHHDPQYVQVDNVPDVIRSRRLSTTTYRAKQSAG